MRDLYFVAVISAAIALLSACSAPQNESRLKTDTSANAKLDVAALLSSAQPVMRVDVRWNESDDTFKIESVETERSGTKAFVAASRFDDPHGSFKAQLVDPSSGSAMAYSVLGTGVAFKKLVQVLTFRFPMPAKAVRFELRAENSTSGKMESVLSHDIEPASVDPGPKNTVNVEARLLREAIESPKLIVNIYAEGYSEDRRETFFKEAAKIPAALEKSRFPKQERMEFRAVFAASNTPLGPAKKLGLPVQVRDSFLGLYFPYWSAFGRYHNVVYPTSSVKYRRALASVPYDYPIALVDDAQYWGVGNFKELTAIPARSEQFDYLLHHEFGHFFGLNEEYSTGGPTELAFAPQMEEPWSQNITFQSTRKRIKWASFIDSNTPVPTPNDGSGQIGLYEGGYGETPKPGSVYIPGLQCIMGSQHPTFCAVCAAAITQRIDFDLGQHSSSEPDEKKLSLKLSQ